MSRLFELNAQPGMHVAGRPVLVVEEGFDGLRVRLTVNGAEVYLRATWGGRKLQVSLDEGDGTVDCEWSVRMSNEQRQPFVTGPYVQSPTRAMLAQAAEALEAVG